MTKKELKKQLKKDLLYPPMWNLCGCGNSELVTNKYAPQWFYPKDQCFKCGGYLDEQARKQAKKIARDYTIQELT